MTCTECGAPFGPDREESRGRPRVCKPCYAQAMREWRDRHPNERARHLSRDYVRKRALTELGRRHPDELQAIIRAIQNNPV